MLKLESQVVGMSKSDEAITANSEVSRMKTAALIVVPMAAPIWAKLSMADQEDSNATLDPANLGATNSKRPRPRKKILAIALNIRKMDAPGRERLAFTAALAFHDAKIKSIRFRKSKSERKVSLMSKNGLRMVVERSR
jgi:hypothetical protein